MKRILNLNLLCAAICMCVFVLFSCQDANVAAPTAASTTEKVFDQVTHETSFVQAMQTHLNAVTNKNLPALKSTMAPNGKLYFMLDERETTYSSGDFIEFHETWFEDQNWSMETKITHTEVGPEFGLAITELTYREPERDGKPYFNRMAVSYVLHFIDGKWYVIKDHATSIERAK